MVFAIAPHTLPWRGRKIPSDTPSCALLLFPLEQSWWYPPVTALYFFFVLFYFFFHLVSLTNWMLISELAQFSKSKKEKRDSKEKETKKGKEKEREHRAETSEALRYVTVDSPLAALVIPPFPVVWSCMYKGEVVEEQVTDHPTPHEKTCWPLKRNTK